MVNSVKMVLGIVLLSAMAGCTSDPKSGWGFTLPEGDAERGKATFVELKCNACHTVAGVELDPVHSEEVGTVVLGGKKGYVVTYGELVTSIINPSHRFAFGYESEQIKDGEVSKMRLYNDEMTVTQLADLVTFLQQHYEVEIYVPTPFVPYY
ncbi:c-type cytochrome [Stieleria mannarensis]|uniref:c-type cytochrome n=1 Tax=Stieleria mannarensis TaxID=2755585 RepID=UPI00160404BA|nr:c-type cytochrome [Rhodopirellula sp. JC639]